MIQLLIAGVLLAAGSAHADTKFKTLEKTFDEVEDTSLALPLDLYQNYGDYRGRCYHKDFPDTAAGMILSIRPYVEDKNGPRFTRRGLRSTLVSSSQGPAATDRLTLEEIESVWSSASEKKLQNAELNYLNNYAGFFIDLSTDVQALVEFVKDRRDGFIYLKTRRTSDHLTLFTCYFWQKRSP